MSERTEKLEALHCEWRIWLRRHPHVTVWRALLWLRWKRVPPWRLTVTQLALIDPKALRGDKLRTLQAYVDQLRPRNVLKTDHEGAPLPINLTELRTEVNATIARNATAPIEVETDLMLALIDAVEAAQTLTNNSRDVVVPAPLLDALRKALAAFA